jgi:tetrahydromethanopterin S-methyltransferase subunit G
MSHLEGAYEQVNQRLAGFDLRFDAIDRKLEAMRSDLVERFDQRFIWTIGIVFTCWFTTMLGIIGILVER